MNPLFILFLVVLLSQANILFAQEPTPTRIVSMNVCTDQLLLLLAEPSHIASLSRFAADPNWSSQAEAARGLATNSGRADEVVSLAPDLVLTSAFSATFAANVLERLHYRVERLGFAQSRADVYAQIAQVAQWIGVSAEPLLANMHARINERIVLLAPVLRSRSAVFLSSNGIAFGSATLQDDFLQSLGLRNAAAEAGLSGPAPMPLEVLLLAAPDYLFSEPRGVIDGQLAHPILRHPALAALSTQHIALPERWFDCASPSLADAYDSLALQLGLAK